MSKTQSSRQIDIADPKVQTIRLATALVFSLVALLFRFAPLPENFACFGALSLFCGLMLKGPMRWALPMMTLFAADCLGHFLGTPQMGFYNVQSMTLNYLGMAAMVLVGTGVGALANLESRNQWQPWAMVAGGCLTGSMLFFLISNFGAWLDPLMGYETSLGGLIQCYTMGLPFFRPTLTSDMLFGVGFYATYRLVAAAVTARAINAR